MGLEFREKPQKWGSRNSNELMRAPAARRATVVGVLGVGSYSKACMRYSEWRSCTGDEPLAIAESLMDATGLVVG